MELIFNELHQKKIGNFQEDDCYWTNDSVRPERAFYFNFDNGKFAADWGKALKSDSYYVRYVRSI